MIDLVACARSLVADGKGLLAADESIGTADKRLATVGITGTPETRRAFRELFLGAEGVEQYLSGVIFFTETLGQKMGRATFPSSVAKRGIVPGIKVDEGTEPIAEGSVELITKGIVGLPERLAGFRKRGARFTKWRAVIRIDGDRLPTARAVAENAERLGAYAHAAQAAGLVPILEPEVLLEGAHSRTRAAAVIANTLEVMFATLEKHVVERAGLILKTSMALSGKDSGRKDTPEEVAEDTLAVLLKTVPRQVAGVVFLSGGQTPDQATANLAAIVALGKKRNAPWPLSFSFARALQEEALTLWKGKEENVEAARAAFLARLAKVSAAAHGVS